MTINNEISSAVGFTLPMVILDIVPVVLFTLAVSQLAGALYNKMTARQYALFSSGAAMCLISAGCRLIWKLLLVFRICDYMTMTEAFYPMQAFGFVLMSFGLQGMLLSQKKQEIRLQCTTIPALLMAAAGSAVPENIEEAIIPEGFVPVYGAHMPFLIVTTIFTAYFSFLLGKIAVKLGKKIVILYLVLEYVGFLALGYIGSRANVSESAMYHWLAEFSNVFAEAFLLLAVKTCLNAGLHDEKSLS